MKLSLDFKDEYIQCYLLYLKLIFTKKAIIAEIIGTTIQYTNILFCLILFLQAPLFTTSIAVLRHPI